MRTTFDDSVELNVPPIASAALNSAKRTPLSPSPRSISAEKRSSSPASRAAGSSRISVVVSQLPAAVQPSVISVCAIASTPSSDGASSRARMGSTRTPAIAGMTCVGRYVAKSRSARPASASPSVRASRMPRLARAPAGVSVATADDVIAEHERVHPRLRERLDRLLRRHHDRLVLVERRVEQDRNAGESVELRDQAVIARVDVLLDGLHASRVVDVIHGGDQLALVGPRLVDEDHERRGVVLLVPRGGLLGEDARRERAERLAVLDARVEDVLHVVPARVGDDRSVAER